MIAPLPIETSAHVIKVNSPAGGFFSYLDKLEADKKAEEARKAAEALRIAQEAAARADVEATANSLKPFGTFPTGGFYVYQCVWYVASRIALPGGLHNANTWDEGLLAAGWRTGSPRRGAIGVSNSGYYGHVVISEHVNPDGSVHISEYNHIPYSYDERDVSDYMFQWFYQ